MKSILNFIYVGQTSVKEEDLERFMIAARDLEIKELFWDFLKNEDETETVQEPSANVLTKSLSSFESIKNVEPEQEIVLSDKYEDLTEQFDKFRKCESDKIPCDQCKYRATTPGILNYHKKNVHSGPKYKCNQCEKCFKTSAMCREHTEIVHTVVLYPCNACGFKASSLRLMNCHKESVHF